MKDLRKSLLVFLLLVGGFSVMRAGDLISDPVRDYVLGNWAFQGEDTIYSDDTLFCLEIDLDHDGKVDLLLSMNRNRNGHQGNVWDVYRKQDGGYLNIGGVELHPNSFYLGPISELKSYGLVFFGPGGGGDGSIMADVVKGGEIKEYKLGEIRNHGDPKKSAEGRMIFNKYLKDDTANRIHSVTEITADELAKRYGVKVDPRTYQQALGPL